MFKIIANLFTFVIELSQTSVYNCKILIVYICKMKRIDIDELSSWYHIHHEKNLEERYLNLKQMQPYLAGLNDGFKVKKIGESFERRDIYTLVFGEGKTNLLLWTQMHGNESTGTRALLDLIKFFSDPGSLSWLSSHILQECTIHCIPMLNPDGAEAYTRINAQGIDLNRDVIEKRAVESRLLQKVLKSVNPHYCFNLHDQRTIFSVGPKNEPATLSFLAPSIDEQRTLTAGRIQTMEVIVAMSEFLQQTIPDSIGRYTDEFYPTATGDNFQKMGHNTILIESGHSKGDYKRKEARRATFMALLEGLRYISTQEEKVDHKKYFKIPDNEKKYLDIIIKNVKVDGEDADIGILFIEKLKEGKVQFIASVDKLHDLSDYNADKILDGKNLDFTNQSDVENWVKNKLN